MPIFDAHLGITKVDEIPVECVGCGTKALLRDLTHASKQHLVDATNRAEFSRELALLQRAAALFSRHPLSNHLAKLAKEAAIPSIPKILKPWPGTYYNQQLQKELEDDDELHHFLSTHGFHLSTRLQWVSSVVADNLATPIPLISCSTCSDGHYILAADFFQRIGLKRA